MTPQGGLGSILATAVGLRAGEWRLDAQEWLSVTLKGSALVMLHAMHHRVVLVGHVDVVPAQSTFLHLRSAVHAIVESLKLEPDPVASIRAKLVVTDVAMLPVVTGYLEQLGIKVQSTKRVAEMSEVWVEPHSVRLLLRRTSPREPPSDST